MDKRKLNSHALYRSSGFLAFLLIVYFPLQVEAVPAFARQLSAECSTCHFQHFPKLNSFGRSFKTNGYSMISTNTLEGDNLSIPSNLNVAFFIRSRSVMETGQDGKWEIPDEAALLFGGRLSEGIGGIVEWGGPLLSAKISLTRAIASIVAGLTVFTTDGLGAGYGFELMNTGAVRNLRPFERSAKPTLGNNDHLELSGAATGLAFYFVGDQWFFAATGYIPDSNEAGFSEMDDELGVSNYLRAAWMPNYQGFDLGVGFGFYRGTSEVTTTDIALESFGLEAGKNRFVSHAWFIDAQLQGMVAGRELGIYFLYARGDEPDGVSNTVRLFAGADGVSNGFGLDIEYNIMPRFSLLAGFGFHDNGSEDLGAKTSVGLGLYWKPRQNITLQPMLEFFGGDQGEIESGSGTTRFTLTFESAF